MREARSAIEFIVSAVPGMHQKDTTIFFDDAPAGNCGRAPQIA
jgi:hypothetical protein